MSEGWEEPWRGKGCEQPQGVFGATKLEVEFEKVVAAPCGSQKEKGWR
jgi:hypothetical protein